MKMENERLCIEISEHGAEVTRYMIKRKRRNFCGREIPRIGKDIPRSFSRT